MRAERSHGTGWGTGWIGLVHHLHKLLTLWSGIALALTILIVGVAFTMTSGQSPGAPLASASEEVAAACVEPSDTARVWRNRDGRPDVVDLHELGALEVETDDEDAQPDATGVPWSMALVSPSGRAPRMFERTRVDTGHPLVSTGLARGPPSSAL